MSTSTNTPDTIIKHDNNDDLFFVEVSNIKDIEFIETEGKHCEDNVKSSVQMNNDNSSNTIIKNSSSMNLLSLKDVPIWINDNRFLPEFHRPTMPSFKECLKSVFSIHTETGNIWTHAIGFLFFLIAIFGFYLEINTHTAQKWLKDHSDLTFRKIVYDLICDLFIGWMPHRWRLRDHLKEHYQMMKLNYVDLKNNLNYSEHAVLVLFFLSGLICLLASTIYHTFVCHSENVSKFLNKVDHVGIVVLMIGSCLPPFYFGFYCFPKIQAFYFTTLLTLGIVHSFMLLFVHMKRTIRAFLFLALGFFISIPSFHHLMLYGWSKSLHTLQLDLIILMGAFYTVGMLLYTYRIPERFGPNLFNLWFQSHQIFHILVVLALFTYFKALYGIIHFRLAKGIICDISLP